MLQGKVSQNLTNVYSFQKPNTFLTYDTSYLNAAYNLNYLKCRLNYGNNQGKNICFSQSVIQLNCKFCQIKKSLFSVEICPLFTYDVITVKCN